METLMSLQQYVRQVRLRTENYISPIDKVQNFLTEASSTEESTKMENVIVACWNNRILKAKNFAEEIVKDKDVISWYSISKLAKGLDGKKLGGGNLTDKRVTDALYKFSQLLKKNAPIVSGTMKGAGTSDPKTSAFWGFHTGKSSDTSKADITFGTVGVSVKGTTARLMSGIAEESKSTAIAAFAKSKGSPKVVQDEILTAMDDMLGSQDRIDIAAPPSADEKSSRTAGQLSADSAIEYGINVTEKPRKKDETTDKYKERLKELGIDYKNAAFTDDRWVTGTNLKTLENPNKGDGAIDWDSATYETLPDYKDKDNDDTEAIVTRMNKAAASAVADATVAKDILETKLKAEFNNPSVKEAFAWEAMSGEAKFNDGAGNDIGEVPYGKGGEGFANQMLVFDWGLKKMSWHEIKENGPNVQKVAKSLNPRFDLKAHSYKAAGKKAGYSFDLTMQMAVKYVADKTDDAKLEVEENTHKAKQMLAEGQLSEFAFWDKVKKIWNSFISTLKIYWDKFVNMLREIKEAIVKVFNTGIYAVLNYFELDVDVKVRTTVRLL